MRITSSLHQHVVAQKLGQVFPADTGFMLSRDPDTVRAPDVAFVDKTRTVRTEKYLPGAPDLAGEVVSTHDVLSEVESKVREYVAAGTRMVIVVNPRNQTATTTTPAGTNHLTLNDILTAGDVVPGWFLPLRELFAN